MVLVFLFAVWENPAGNDERIVLNAAPQQQAVSFAWQDSNGNTITAGNLDIIQGQQNQRFDVTLANTGTQSSTVTVSQQNTFPSNEAWSITVDPNLDNPLTRSLSPNQQQAFRIFISAPSDAGAGTHTLTLNARADDGSDYQFVLNVTVTEATPTPTNPPATAGLELSVDDRDKNGDQGETVRYTLTIRNTGEATGNYEIFIEKSCADDIDRCDESLSTDALEVAGNDSTKTFDVSVLLPSDADDGEVGRTTVRVRLVEEGIEKELVLTTTVVEVEETNTPTPTRTPTPTVTPTPGRICEDIYENDDVLDDATVIDVNVSQPKPDDLRKEDDPDDRRAICPPGDEDWLKFAAIQGKVYTIDVVEMEQGIDLSLELYDEDGRSIAFNDDYFKRGDENVAVENEDIRPRIDSWRAPADGIYYIRVRDVALRGGMDRTYKIEIRTESYGPTPITINEVCEDKFEPDGLPEQASLIVSNERQENRSLCPMGDADWVTFFGKSGKRYFIYTDTGPYMPDNRINDAEAGADTFLVLTDRDGVSMLDFNDDAFGGSTLDSQIEFNPTVDGFYYVQVKNIGDIGNQFIRYDLVLELCKPGQTDCGRIASVVSNDNNAASAVNNPATPVPTVPSEEMSLDPTSTPVPPPDPDVSNLANAPPPSTPTSDLSYSQSLGFSSLSFWKEWQRADLPVADQRVVRSWIWGSAPLVARNESYRQAAGGVRQVQYFDKGRMEINNPDGDSNHPWFVTFGLLAEELVKGHVQVGDHEYEPRNPATIPIIGDNGDTTAPTYATFEHVMGTPAPDLTGEDVLDRLNRDGTVGLYEGAHRPEARLVHFAAESSHNIPLAFWRFLNTHGEVYKDGEYVVGPLLDWNRVVGYPISEPYWIRARIDGVERDVMAQIYQRRILFFIPDKPPGQQVHMSNIGRHYYQWRYGEPLP
jgi:hypothetical protein